MNKRMEGIDKRTPEWKKLREQEGIKSKEKIKASIKII